LLKNIAFLTPHLKKEVKIMPKKDVKMLELTPKQMKFVNIFIEKGTIQSARQCALDAGFAESGATVIASQLQNPKYYPHVVAEIERRRAELNRRYSISYKSHIQKLAELRDSAEKAGNFTGAIAAEKYRGMVAGLYIDRKEVMHGTIDSMSVGEVEDKLIELRKKLSIQGEYEIIDHDASEGTPVGEPGDDILIEEGESGIQDDS
jgi:phage terminase small subunit